MIPLYLSKPSLQLPDAKLSNADVIARVRARYRGPEQKWPVIELGLQLIFEASHSRERYRELDPAARLGTTAVRACRNILEQYGLEPERVDALVYGGICREYLEPATAMEVSAKLGLDQVKALDVTSACAGQLMGIYTACGWFHLDDTMQHALITSAEIFGEQHTYDIQSYDELAKHGAGITIGDGASAWILSRTPLKGGCLRIRAIETLSLPQHWQLSQSPIQGRFTARASEMLRVGEEAAPMIPKVLEGLGWTVASIDQFLMHQPGHAMHVRLLNAVGIPHEKAIDVHPLYGNTATVAVATAFHEYFQRGIPSDGARLVLVATGAGMTGCVIAGEWVA